MTDPFTFAAITTLITTCTPSWMDSLRGALLDKGRDSVIEKGIGFGRDLLHLDEKEQLRHLELALKNAVERGLAPYRTIKERDQYRDILLNLFEPGPHSEVLRREALTLFSLSEAPNFTELNKIYNRSLRIRNLSQPTPPTQVNAAPYLNSFFEALVAELYEDPFFKQQMSDVIQVRAAMSMQRSLTEVVATLHQIGEKVADNYTTEQFEQDVVTYTSHIERAFRYLKLVGVVPKDRGDRNADPDLNGVFVPLRIAFAKQSSPDKKSKSTIEDFFELNPHIVLLGGPGSGKSTSIRHLMWSHAIANLSSNSTDELTLLPGMPLPLRIELRRFTEDRRQHPDYNFLSYATEVLLGREGIEIRPQMFKELLERKIMLLLFDGLDEVATLEERRRLVEEIEHFTMTYPGNRVLVTSRPIGYELASFSNQIFFQAQIQEFNNEQIREFLVRWYTHVLRLSPIPNEDQQELEKLFTTLKGNTRLHKLAENPLLLAVITALHRYERLPDKRVLVYDRCTDLLIDTWAKLRGTDTRWKDMKLGKEDQFACVAHLGFILHERSQESESNNSDVKKDIASDVSTRFLLKGIELFLHSRKLISEKAERRAEAKRFINLMQVEAGLIVERGTDENGEPLYGFVHRTFQEYFAAADVYERYQQEEDPTIISEFLKEHLHDPHWREVILLLLGKLKRKPATTQLNQILEGKIMSPRSKYTDFLQQDLFFVCDCLIEEIAVENELVEVVLSRLGDLVKGSPFSSQRSEALSSFDSLAATKQYIQLTQKNLIKLITQDGIKIINTKIDIAEILYLNSDYESSEEQQALQILLKIAQYPDTTFEEALYVARTIFQLSSPRSREKQIATEIVLDLLKFPHISFNQAFLATRVLRSFNREVFAAIEESIKLPEPSFEEVLQMAMALYLITLKKSNEFRKTINAFLSFENLKLLFEQFMQIFQTIKLKNPVPARWVWMQLLFNLSQQPHFSLKQVFRLAENLGQSHSFDITSATQMLLEVIQKRDSTTEQSILASQVLYQISLPKPQKAIQILTDLLNESTKTFKENLLIFQVLCIWNPYNITMKYESISMLVQFLDRYQDISLEENLQVIRILYQISLPQSQQEQIAIQMLSDVIIQPTLSFEQKSLVGQMLYLFSIPGSEQEQTGNQILLDLMQQSNVSYEQIYNVNLVYTISQIVKLDAKSKERANIKVFIDTIHGTELSIEQKILAAQIIYSEAENLKFDERWEQVKGFWQSIQDEPLTTNQQLQILKVIFIFFAIDHSDTAEAVRLICTFLSKDEAKQYFDETWFSVNFDDDIAMSDIPFIIELAKQALLPEKTRNEMYQLLRGSIAQFDKITTREPRFQIFT